MRSEVQVLPGPQEKSSGRGAALFFPNKSNGAIAQLVAHLLCKQRVAGSNPASSTISRNPGIARFRGFSFAGYSPARQNLGQAEEAPQSPPTSGAKPRPDRENTAPTPPQRSKTSGQQRNRPTESHSERQNLGRANGTPQTHPTSRAEPRADRWNTTPPPAQ